VPEIRRGQGEHRNRPHRSDLGSRHVRGRLSVQGRMPLARVLVRRLLVHTALPPRICGPPAAIGNQTALADPTAVRPPSPQNPAIRKPIRRPCAGSVMRRPIGPISLTAPGVPPEEDEINLPPGGVPGDEAAGRLLRTLSRAPQAAPPASAQPYPPSRESLCCAQFAAARCPAAGAAAAGSRAR